MQDNKDTKKTKPAPVATEVSFAAEREEIKSRKFKYGTMAAATAAIFIVAIIIVNVFIGYMTDRFVFEFDMTSEKLFEISEDTKEIIDDLSEPITITVLAEETSYRNGQEMLGNIYEILQRYVALGNGKITVRYIDPLINVGEVDRFKEKLGGALTTNDIVVESSKRMKRLAPQNLYTAKQDNFNGAQVTTATTGTTYYVGLRAEQRLSSALLFVTSDEVSKAAWIYGHDENYAIPEFETLLGYANYDVMNLRLIQDEIPDDVTLLILSAPARDFTTGEGGEIEKLSAFLERGGDMIVAMGPQGINHPNLDLLFEEWGVKYGRDIIYDSSQCVSGMFEYVLPNMQLYDSITANMPRQYPVIGGGRPITMTDSQSGSITVTPLLTSSTASYSKRYEDALKTNVKSDSDAEGPFNMTVLSERLVADKNQFYTRSSILFTNAGFITQSVLVQPAFLNRTYIGSTLNYISDYTEGLVIPDKDFVSKLLTITGAQNRAVLFTIVLGLPALIVIFGVIVWARRKHL